MRRIVRLSSGTQHLNTTEGDRQLSQIVNKSHTSQYGSLGSYSLQVALCGCSSTLTNYIDNCDIVRICFRVQYELLTDKLSSPLKTAMSQDRSEIQRNVDVTENGCKYTNGDANNGNMWGQGPRVDSSLTSRYKLKKTRIEHGNPKTKPLEI